MNSLSLLRRPGFLIVISSLASLVLIAASIRASRASGENVVQQQPTVSVKVLPQKLEVVSLRKTGRNLEIGFRNGYDRGITAFTVSVDRTNYVEDVIYYGDGEVAPGAVKTTQFELRSPSTLPEIVVEAVVFDGQNYEGVPQRALDVFFRRTGARRQLASVYPYFDRMVSALNRAPGNSINYELTQLSEALSLLTTEKPPGKPPHFGVGLQIGKEIVERIVGSALGELNRSDRNKAKSGLSVIRQDFLSLLVRLDQSSMER
jgi:hypothetical protein